MAVDNTAPSGTATALLVSGTEDITYTINASDLLAGFSDVNPGDVLSVANLSASTGTLYDNNDGTWTFTPYANVNGIVNLSYNVIDGQGGSVVAAQSFNMVAVNDTPLLTGVPAALSAGTEDTTYTILANSLLQGFTDVDSNALSVQSGSLTADHGTLTPVVGGWSFTPDLNYSGPVTLSYNVIDNSGASVVATQSFNVVAANGVPTLGGITASTTIDDIATASPFSTFTITDNDVNAAVSVSITLDTAAKGVFTAESLTASGFSTTDGGLTYNHAAGTPAALQAAIQQLIFQPAANRVATGDTETTTFTVSVNDGIAPAVIDSTTTVISTSVNDAPVITFGSTGTVAENAPIITVIYDASASDADTGDTLTYSLQTGLDDDAALLAIDADTGAVTLLNSANFEAQASYSFTVVSTDSANAEATKAVTVEVTNVNEAPTFAQDSLGGSVSFTEDNAPVLLDGNVILSDEDLNASNYNGSTLTLVRNGGANAEDSFSSAALTGADVIVESITIGTFAQAGGTLTISFNANATQALVNGALQQIAYSNSSNTPPASVQLDWTFNEGTQGMGASLTTTGNTTVNITPTNDAPAGAASAELGDATEDTAYTITASDLLTGFSDVENDTLLVDGLTADNGDLVNNNDGTWTFTPATNYNGNVALNYNVIDGNGGSVAATQGFNVAAVNDAPTGTANDELIGGTEDTVYTIYASDLLVGFSDVENDTLSVDGLTANNGLLVNNNDGTWTFTPTANFNGEVALAYNVIDGNGGSVAATQGFSVAAVNDAPTGTASAELVAGTEDTVYTINASDLLMGFSDVENDMLSVANLTATNGTLVNNNDGTWTFTPAANFNGAVALAYDVIDGNGGSIVATQSFSLASVNDATTGAPTAVLGAGIEDTPYIINIETLLQGFSDIDGTLAIANFTANNGTLFNNNNDTWTFTPNANYNGAVALTYNVIDGNGGSISATQSFSLAAVNDTPVGSASATLAAGTEDTDYTILANTLLQGFSDADGDALTVANLTVSNGTLAAISGGWIFTPNANYNGSVALTYNVIDDNGGSIAATQSFNLTPVNDGPPTGTASAELVAGLEDTAYTINAIDLLQGFIDVDNDTLSVANLVATNGTVVNNNDGTWTFTPTANYNGAVALTYDVLDGTGGSIAATQSFSLVATNDAPTGSATAVLVAGTEDTTYTINASDLLVGFSDIDGATLAVDGLTATNGDLVNNNDGTWTFTPAANYNGAVALTYNVIDGNGGSVPATQSFSLTSVNDGSPTGTASAELAAGTEDTAYTLSASDLLMGFSDVEADTLSVANLTATNGDLVNNNDGTWTFTPATNFNGAVALAYDVMDGNGGSVAATQGFNVAAVNDAPAGSASAELLAGIEDTAYTVSASDLLMGFSDVEADTLSVANLTATNGDLVNNNDGTWTFTPAANFNGAVALAYDVIDGNGGSMAATQGFSVAPVDDVPVLIAPVQINFIDTALTDSFITATGTLAVSDVENSSVTYNIIDGTDNGDTVSKDSQYGILTVSKATGNYAFVANDDAINALAVAAGQSFTVTASDGLLIDSKSLLINIAQDGSTESIDNDTLVGALGNDILHGLAGNDFINGSLGADIMFGGLGDDTYFVDNAFDIVTEDSTLATEIDTIESEVNYTLSANVENLTLTGTAINGAGNGLSNLLTGNAEANNLRGGAGADTLNGGEGADFLNGNSGVDTLIGGLGNDSYIVDNIGDVVVENSSLATEIDSVSSSITYTLPANVENLILTGTAINGIGNTLNNVLTGNGGANKLLGGAGADTLNGGAGVDTLNGNSGADILNGGLGNDILTGGTGNDIFQLTNLSKDTITDFVAINDTIQLENSIFAQLTATGALNANNFRLGSAEADADDYVVYNNTTGALFYDADGNGADAATQVAILGTVTHPNLTVADFVII
ncbi:conserved hypothetical protein [Crenothrix polyspora]|uniref:Cadherin domain-containing protein n=1 Tax=Crenothrix polyspora TaxID=360316 RepID=A0A1R4HI58_9GAMM|nr:cadherin-like domain-containing protein [Crenothrix polyspora]SJM95907.1 conserved hypothetical protein [Crenothrix polyspora]